MNGQEELHEGKHRAMELMEHLVLSCVRIG